MSKADNLKDFLTDLADAIRAKKGSTDLINPQDFSSEIASLPSGLEIVDMTETTATIEPNKVYVWGMVESLNITLGASTDVSDFFAFRFRCSKPTMTSVTVNGATWADDTELDAQGKPILDLGSWYQCEIKGGTSALYARLAHYIHFADSNVEAVLLANGVGDGLGITYKDAAKVTSISTWFKDNADITSFNELEKFIGVKTIPSRAFYGATNLQSIDLTNITTFTNGANFKNASSLNIVLNIPNLTGVIPYGAFEKTAISGIENLGSVTAIQGAVDVNAGGWGNHSAFRKCTNLKFANLPSTLTTIEYAAFAGCSQLTEINFGDKSSITSIRVGAFCDVPISFDIDFPNLTGTLGYAAFQNTKIRKILNLGSISIIDGAGDSVGPYGSYGAWGAFKNCKELTDVTLPSSLTTIGIRAFYGCSALASMNFPSSLTTIGQGAFYGCSALASMNFPSSLTTIGKSAFQNCTSLTEITLPAGVTSIQKTAFAQCTSLAEIALPDTLTGIEEGAFIGCSSLQYIRIEATTPPTLSATNAIPSTIGAIYVPDESVAAYQAATNWSSFASKIKGISEMPAK